MAASRADDSRRRHLTCALAAALVAGTAWAAFIPTFPLSTLDGTNGAALHGASAEAQAGLAVSAAGDFNGDGVDDLIVGAPYGSFGAVSAGAAHVVFGNPGGLSNPLDLSAIGVGSGLTITGTADFDFAGHAVGAAGDVNADGLADVVIGGPGASLGAEHAGAAFVVFGSDQPLPAALDVSALNGANGFALVGGTGYADTGAAVSGAGDVNGDGIDDLVIGAPFSGGGAAYLVFGSGAGWNATVDLSTLDGTNGIRIDGANEGDALGFSVSGAGDLNGDGVDDLVLGALLAGAAGVYPGAAYVVFGSDGALAHPLNVAALDGSNGFALIGASHGDAAGYAVSRAGDVNGDALDDVLVGAPGADANGDSAGAGYVVFGSEQPWASALNLADLDGSNGFAILGVAAGDEAGSAVGAAGDLDGDGFDDLLVGAPQAGYGGALAGASYLVRGSGAAWPSTVNLAALTGANGFRILGAGGGDKSGASVSAAGDVNSNGQPDLLVGAPEAGPGGNLAGAAYLIFDATPSGNPIIFADSFEQQ